MEEGEGTAGGEGKEEEEMEVKDTGVAWRGVTG